MNCIRRLLSGIGRRNRLTLTVAALAAMTGLKADATAPAHSAPPSAESASGDEAPAESLEDGGATDGLSQDTRQFVANKVRPLLESRCLECHGSVDEPGGGLQLLSRAHMLRGGDSGAAIVPGESNASLLIEAIRYESFEMPPRTRLPQEEVDLLVRWVDMGAPWPDDSQPLPLPEARPEFPLEARRAEHWAWSPIRRTAPPSVNQNAWPSDQLDHFVLHHMESAGLSPAPDASRRALLRRAHAVITGLPPTLQEQQTFLEDPQPTPAALADLVDRLLASPHFGERWGRHWLDLVRYAESLGHEFDYPLPHAWQYRDYVIRAFNADVPYDQFLREHVAGDLLPNPRRHPEGDFNESIIGTGFWYLGEDKHAPVDVRGEEAARIDNQIDVFSRAFMGLTVACARCHDHKFDAIPTDDYYALAGFLQSSRRRIHYLDDNHQIGQQLTGIDAARQTLQAQLTAAAESVTVEAIADQLAVAIAAVRSRAATGNETGNERDAADAPPLSPLSTLLATAETRDSVFHPLSPAARLAAVSPPPPEDTPAPGDTPPTQPSGDPAPSEATRSASPDLSHPSESSAFADIAADWCRAVVSAEPPADTHGDTLLLADLRNGLADGWRAYGSAFAHLTSAKAASDSASGRPQVQWTPQGIRPVAAQGISSAAAGPRFRGVLMSPTFELAHPELLVRVAGENARLRLVVDGYVMSEFSELLFQGTRQVINTGGKDRWIRLAGDTGRYVGHRCHFEFLDEGDGWFRVSEIRYAKSPGATPPQIVASETDQLFARDLADRWNTSPPESEAELLTALAASLRERPDWPALAADLQLIAPAEAAAKSLSDWEALAAEPFSGRPVLVMCDGSPEDEYVFIRGNHRNLGRVASRRFLTALSVDEPAVYAEHDGSGRLLLAERMLSDANPFPARVMVNRVWHHVFGQGLVASTDNFGVLGQSPSHPELLDRLAADFRDDGWSVKRLIRRLMLSRTWRLASDASPDAERIDPLNRLLSHAHVRRQQSEILRDAMLTVSGQLDRTLYGEPVPVHLTAFMQGRGRPQSSGPLDGAGRRSIYQAVRRNFLSPFMQVFDTPPPSTAVGRRSESNVPAQALMLLNNAFVQQQAERWADHILSSEPDSGQAALEIAWQQAFSRRPTSREAALLSDFAAAQAAERGLSGDDPLLLQPILADVCHVIFNQKEFLFLD